MGSKSRWRSWWARESRRGELGDVAGEGVKEADGGVPVALQEEEAVWGVEDAVVAEEREGDADECGGGGGGEVEEAGVAGERAVAREAAEALREHHPPRAGVEARVQHAAAPRGGRGGAPRRAHRPEPDVVRRRTPPPPAAMSSASSAGRYAQQTPPPCSAISPVAGSPSPPLLRFGFLVQSKQVESNLVKRREICTRDLGDFVNYIYAPG